MTDTIIIHDGATDELMSILLAASMPNINIKGIMVVNADCLGYPTAKVSSKLLDLISLGDIPVALSAVKGWNAFPWSYRQYALMVNLLPIVNQYKADVAVPEPITDLNLAAMVDAIYHDNNNTPITLLCLSPLSDIAQALHGDPGFKSKIAEIVWMGGVYITEDTPTGNIDTGIAPGANPNAEWNVYWDPQAAQDVLNSDIPLTLFPLNVSNRVTLSSDIIRQYFLPASGDFPSLALAAQMYALVAFQNGFSFWDTVATAYLGNAGLYTFQRALVNVDTCPDPAQQGTLSVEFIAPNSMIATHIKIATTINVSAFYDYYVEQLKTLTFKR